MKRSNRRLLRACGEVTAKAGAQSRLEICAHANISSTMGDEPIELDLEFGGGGYVDDDDQYFDNDVEDSDDDVTAHHQKGATAVTVKKEEDTDDEGAFPADADASFTTNARVKKEEDDVDNDNAEEAFATTTTSKSKSKNKIKMKRPTRSKKTMKYIQGPPPTLLHLTTQIVANNIEKYPPAAIGSALFEHHWEGVIRARLSMAEKKADQISAPKRLNGNAHIGYDGNRDKKRLPAMSEKILTQIESHPRNVHLSKSRAADELLWKSIVDYHFCGVMSRPRSLEIPCDMLKERLRGWGEQLLEVIECPLSQDEYTAKHGQKQGNSCSSGSKPRMSETDELFGEESDEEEDNEVAIDIDSSDRERYHQYLEIQSTDRTNSMKHILKSLEQSPMDVTLLLETEVGIRASKTVKAMKKLKKQVMGIDDEREIEEKLCGYPRFWELISWGKPHRVGVNQWEDVKMSLLEVLQQILLDWKDMANEDKSRPPTKKQKLDNGQSASSNIIATCGRDKKLSLEQHQIDMKLLHESPDWRHLCQSIRKREEIMRKSHGDKVRSIRENLQAERRTVGKVVLKKAVGRVRGNDIMKGTGGVAAAMSQSLRGLSAGAPSDPRKEKREAILGKTLGNKAKQQRVAQTGFASAGSRKLSKLRQETKVAASIAGRPSSVARSKPSSFSTAVARSSFGASVAGASGNNSGRGSPKKQQPQVNLKLRGGKLMKLPPASARGTGKASLGVFSSLQKKKAQEEQQQRQQQRQRQEAAHQKRVRQMQQQQRGGNPAAGKSSTLRRILSKKR